MIKRLEGRNVHVFITPLKLDEVCAFEDSVGLPKIADYVRLLKVKNNSKNFEHTIHRYINNELNRIIAQNILTGNFNLTKKYYELFKNSL